MCLHHSCPTHKNAIKWQTWTFHFPFHDIIHTHSRVETQQKLQATWIPPHRTNADIPGQAISHNYRLYLPTGGSTAARGWARPTPPPSSRRGGRRGCRSGGGQSRSRPRDRWRKKSKEVALLVLGASYEEDGATKFNRSCNRVQI